MFNATPNRPIPVFLWITCQLLMISLTTSMRVLYADPTGQPTSLPGPAEGSHTCSQLPQALTAAGAEVWVGAHYFFVDHCQNEGKVF